MTKNPAADKVNVTINTNSVDTNHAERDKHLRSGEFLNVGKYPQATFTSTRVKKEGDKLNITGNADMYGVTKPVTLDAKLLGQGDDPWGGKRAGFEAAGKIHLKDFNITTDLGPASQDVELVLVKAYSRNHNRFARQAFAVPGVHPHSGSGIPSLVFRRPRDLLKILLPFSRPARRRRCSSSGRMLSSLHSSLQQPEFNFSAQAGH